MLNIGIDWSQTRHDVCFLNEAGAVVTHLTVLHTPDGFLKLDSVRQQLGVTANECRVGLETAHNLLIDSPAACGARATARREACHSAQCGERHARTLPPKRGAHR